MEDNNRIYRAGIPEDAVKQADLTPEPPKDVISFDDPLAADKAALETEAPLRNFNSERPDLTGIKMLFWVQIAGAVGGLILGVLSRVLGGAASMDAYGLPQSGNSVAVSVITLAYSIAIIVLTIVGYTKSIPLAKEFKKARRNLLISIIAGVVAGVVFGVGLATYMLSQVGIMSAGGASMAAVSIGGAGTVAASVFGLMSELNTVDGCAVIADASYLGELVDKCYRTRKHIKISFILLYAGIVAAVIMIFAGTASTAVMVLAAVIVIAVLLYYLIAQIRYIIRLYNTYTQAGSAALR